MSNDNNRIDNSKIISLFPNENGKGVPKEIPKEVNVAINIVDGKVVIAFREPVKAITFARQQAIDLAHILISAACNINVK